MAPPIKTHCKRGHPFTAMNTRMVKLQTGYTVRQCKRCRAVLDNLRYKNDPKRRAAIRARAIIRYRCLEWDVAADG